MTEREEPEKPWIKAELDKWKSTGGRPVSKPDTSTSQSQIALAAVLAASIIGLVMAMQSTSLFLGTGRLWTGAALAVGAAVAGLVMKNLVPTWARIVAALVAILAIWAVVSVEQELDEKRAEIQSDLGG